MNKLYISPLILSVVLLFGWSMSSAKAADIKEGLAKEKPIDSYKVIRVHSYGGISPKLINIKPGTIVIWVNDSRSEINVQFKGKQVTLACKSPVHFVVDDQGSYISNRIPPDAVASLCFVEKGEFNYVMKGSYRETGSKNLERIKEYKGKIVVE